MLFRSSESTKPAPIEHSPRCKRLIWRERISSLSLSTTSSKGSTDSAASISLFKNAFNANSEIFSVAAVSTLNSESAAAVKCKSLFLISSAASNKLTAWSDILSKSPIIFSSFAASLLPVSYFSYSTPAPYQLAHLEHYLINSFAWQEYDSFVNTGAPTLFETPKVYFSSAGSLSNSLLKNPTCFIQTSKAQ